MNKGLEGQRQAVGESDEKLHLKLNVRTLYAHENGSRYCFIETKPQHCQMHGDYIGEYIHLVKKREFYSPKNGYWKTCVSVFGEDVISKLKPIGSIPDFAQIGGSDA